MRRAPLDAILAGAAAVALSFLAGAPPSRAAVTPASVRTMQIALVPGKSQVLATGRPYGQAMVGNPEVADVLPMTGAQIYVLGKKTGTTNLTLYDRAHALIGVIDISVGPDGDGFARQIAALMPRERIGVRASNDALILDGTVSSAVAAQRAVAVAETFAPGKVVNLMGIGSPQQVLLEVRFSEVNRQAVEQLGIRSVGLSNKGNGTLGTPTFASSSGDVPTDTFATIAGSFGIGGVNINLRLDALEQKGLVTTLAEPNLMALSGETASFLAGGEFPIPVSSTRGGDGTPTVTIEFKQFGVQLAFTPTVLDDGIVNLAVAQEVSSLDPTASITLNSIRIPGLKTRRAKTTVELRDGQSFAVAGLIQSDFTDTARQVPLLGSIPLLGALFRSSSFQRGETELVMVVTPHLVRPAPAGSIKVPTDRIGSPEAADLLLRGKTESRRSLPPLPPEVSR